MSQSLVSGRAKQQLIIPFISRPWRVLKGLCLAETPLSFHPSLLLALPPMHVTMSSLQPSSLTSWWNKTWILGNPRVRNKDSSL